MTSDDIATCLLYSTGHLFFNADRQVYKLVFPPDTFRLRPPRATALMHLAPNFFVSSITGDARESRVSSVSTLDLQGFITGQRLLGH